MSADQHPSVMRVRDILIATLPAHPSDSTVENLQNRILARIETPEDEPINGVILDVTPVQTVDSFFARTIVETANMVDLMGAHPVLVGISPAIAITVTELGFSLGDVDTALSTDAALDRLNDDTR